MTDIFQKAQWIMAPCESQEIIDKYFEYRTTFTGQTGAEALLYISASTQYVVYINGQFVDCGQYEGYEDYQVYDTLDISKYLQDGENELWIGHYVCGEEFSTRRILIPGIIFEVHSGDQVLLYSDEQCKARANAHYLKNREKISPQLGFNFEYDACAAEAEFGKWERKSICIRVQLRSWKFLNLMPALCMPKECLSIQINLDPSPFVCKKHF